jgi:hypothetical protein
MAILGYEPTIRCALADAPDFPPEEELTVINHRIDLDEWRSYFVKFYGEVWAFFPRAPYVVSREFSGKIFEINFENSVGLSKIGNLRIQVCNRKIGDETFYALLDFISNHYANLVSDWNTATGYGHRQDIAGRNIPYIEFLLLKKCLLSAEQSLESLVTAILADPHRRLRREVRYQPIEKAVAPEPALIMVGLSKPGNTVRLRSGHTLLNTALGRALAGHTERNLYLQQVLEERKYHSYDTPGNAPENSSISSQTEETFVEVIMGKQRQSWSIEEKVGIVLAVLSSCQKISDTSFMYSEGWCNSIRRENPPSGF